MIKKKFYISSLDSALNGGIPEKNTILVAGSAGTGKTTLSMEFLCEGAKQGKEVGIFFSMNESEAKLKTDFEEFSFFGKDLVDNQKLILIDMRTVYIDMQKEYIKKKGCSSFLGTPDDTLDFIAKQMIAYKPKRIVIDSLTAVCHYFKDNIDIREFIFKLGNLLALFGCTSLLISEISPDKRNYSNFDIEEFIADGIIYLQHVEKNNKLVKTLQIVKMRGDSHSDERFLLNIQKKGITLLKMMDFK